MNKSILSTAASLAALFAGLAFLPSSCAPLSPRAGTSIDAARPPGEESGPPSLPPDSGEAPRSAADSPADAGGVERKSGEAQAERLAPAGIPAAGSTGNAPEFRILLENFHGLEIRGGERRYIFWNFDGPAEALVENPFSIYYSADGGKEWKLIASRLDAGARKLAWSLPALRGDGILVRIHALLRGGGYLTDTSRTPCRIDSRPPAVFFDGPPISRRREVSIGFHAISPALPVAEVEYRVARRGVEAAAGVWKAREAKTEWRGKIPVQLEDGIYDVELLVRDRAGAPSGKNAPSRGQLLVDTRNPDLQVRPVEDKDMFSGGEELTLEISANDDHQSSHPVTIRLAEGRLLESRLPGEAGASGEETSGGAGESEFHIKTLASRFPSSGKFTYRMPQQPCTRTIQVIAADLAGNRSTFEFCFRVQAERPAVELLSFNRPCTLRGGDKAEIRWQTRLARPDASKASLALSRDAGRTWEMLAENVDNLGAWTWQLPHEDFRGGLLRIQVRNQFNQVNEAISAPFVVSSTRPKARITAVEASD